LDAATFEMLLKKDVENVEILKAGAERSFYGLKDQVGPIIYAGSKTY